MMTDAAASLAWRAEYLPFGKTHSLAVNKIANTLRFTGQVFDSETRNHQNVFRDFAPGLGRFFEPDPTGLLSGSNLYVYVSNNPVALVDPFGLYECTYSITMHEMTCRPDDPRNPPFTSNLFVAGNNLDPNCTDCQNNPNRTGMQNHGPVPVGTYAIGRQRSGSSRRDLAPAPGNKMFGRFGFQIHGCRNPASCSEGCIAATTSKVRDQFNRLMTLEEGNNRLTVVP